MRKKKTFYLSIIALISFFSVLIGVNAASLSLKENFSSSSTVVGNTFTVTFRMSSSVPLGYINYSMNYDSSKLTLVSGTQNNALYSFTGSEKQTTVTFKFKAKSKGTASVSLKINEALDFDGNNLTGSYNVSKSITIKTQAEIEASYSKNNNLSKLAVSDGTLSPTFSKDITNYSLEVPYEVSKITVSGTKEDSKSYVDGFKTYELEEGINKINVKVTAQNGSSKTYTINVTRNELTPIIVEVDGKSLNVVRKKELLEVPNSNYTDTTIAINNEDIPAFINNVTNTTLVGLKDADGNIKLYIYDNNNYTLYKEYTFDSIIITEASGHDIPEGYQKTSIIIGDNEITAFKEINNTDEYYLLNGKNINTGEEHLYQYNSKENTIQIFNNSMLTKISELEEKEDNYLYVIIGLGGALIITYIFILISSIRRASKTKKRKREEIERRKREIEDEKHIKNEKVVEEIDSKGEKDDKIKEDISKRNKKKKK